MGVHKAAFHGRGTKLLTVTFLCVPPPPRQHMEALRRLQAAAEAALRMEEERKEWGETPKWDP